MQHIHDWQQDVPAKSPVIKETATEAPANRTEEKKKKNGNSMPAVKKTQDKGVKKAASKKAVKQTKAPETETKVVKKTTAKPTAKAKKTEAGKTVKITFQLRFHTEFGQNLFITGNHEILGNDNIEQAIPMQYFNENTWYATIELPVTQTRVTYNYLLRNQDGSVNYDWGNDKVIAADSYKQQEVLIIDSWNHAGYFENAFYTEPFQKVLLKENHNAVKASSSKKSTHTFQVKAPLLTKDQTLCLLGNVDALNQWNTENPLLMSRDKEEVHFTVNIDLSATAFPIAYKYGVYDTTQKKFVKFEQGDNRVLFDTIAPSKQTIVNDAFAGLPSSNWKGAGIAIPVFSLRSNDSFGIGEFTDIKKLVDWSKEVGLKLIQLLPVNDTTATHTWMDSYPYAAISAFALHPAYLNLEATAATKNKKLLASLKTDKITLNALEVVDYVQVVRHKFDFVRKIYPSQKESDFKTAAYKEFFDKNEHWLVPYAAFCYLRDKYQTADFNQWPEHVTYDDAAIHALAAPGSAAYDDIAIHYFIQYHLHLQLSEATAYAHANGVIVKGDIAIGIYRYGSDAWQHPELYHMNVQAGAPPDDFAVKGQNWGFPTYNWQRMKEDGFTWWKQRFEQMSYYFDAFRIDHILGFFRIWSIPMHAVEGIMGYFVPAIPVHENEFNQRGIYFNDDRFVKPFINDQVLWEIFGHNNEEVKERFLNYDGFGNYNLKPEFTTQRQVEAYFASAEDNDHNNSLRTGLYNLISNVILFPVEGSNNQQFHFRFAMENTYSFRYLDGNTQHQLRELYINYFFRRQDDFWMKEALQKLPALKRVTNMLVCGEDLGLVPSCVPDVMKQLGLLSLEIQRMPKDASTEFFNPRYAPYLSVVTPSTHDMSTIRGWWEEDKQKIQRFYNNELHQGGEAPYYCEPWINTSIVLQHLHSPAMWSIFQLQDLLGMSEELRRNNPEDERINIPADPKHYWRYRMHLSLEELQQAAAFNTTLKEQITQSGR